ncbi:MAG TPA: RcpC/CpaB family pilus assembly protein [Actinomycetota bacterium]|nr:RcpC/CpaB family pilus assembly protein [Actinomycetota bacterium]
MDILVGRTMARPRWVNSRVVLGTVLVLLAVAGGRAVMTADRSTTAVLVASRALVPGTAVDPGAVGVERVHLDPGLLARYLPATTDLRALVVTSPIPEGTLIPAETVGPPQDRGRGRAITIPVEPDHAVGGDLHPGDLIDVYATYDAGDVRPRTQTLVRATPVVGLVTDGGFVAGDSSVVGITVSVPPSSAQRIAFASRVASLDIARVDGAGTGR